MDDVYQMALNGCYEVARDRADKLAAHDSPLVPILTGPMLAELEDAPFAVQENTDCAIDRVLGRYSEQTRASRWLAGALMMLADEFAEEFAEDVRDAAEACCAKTQGGE